MKNILTLACAMIALTACSKREATKSEIQSPLISCSPSVEPNYAAAAQTTIPMTATQTREHENALVAMLQPVARREQNENVKRYAK